MLFDCFVCARRCVSECVGWMHGDMTTGIDDVLCLNALPYGSGQLGVSPFERGR
jgi:hypothetical protein